MLVRMGLRSLAARPAIARHPMASQAYAIVTKETAAESSAALSAPLLRGCASLAHVGSWCSRRARRLSTVPPNPFADQVRKLVKDGMAQDPREIAARGRISPFSARLVVMLQLANQEPLFTKWMIRAGVATTLIPTATAYILHTGTTLTDNPHQEQGLLMWVLYVLTGNMTMNDAMNGAANEMGIIAGVLVPVFVCLSPIILPILLFSFVLEVVDASKVVVLPVSGAHLVLWQSRRWYPHWARAMHYLGAASSTAAVLVLVPTLLGWMDTAAGAAPKKHDKERTAVDDDHTTRADGDAAKKMVAKPDEAVIDWVAVGTLFTIFAVAVSCQVSFVPLVLVRTFSPVLCLCLVWFVC